MSAAGSDVLDGGSGNVYATIVGLAVGHVVSFDAVVPVTAGNTNKLTLSTYVVGLVQVWPKPQGYRSVSND